MYLQVEIHGYYHNKRGVFVYTDNGNRTSPLTAIDNARALAEAHPDDFDLSKLAFKVL